MNQNNGLFELSAQCNLYMDQYNPATETWEHDARHEALAEDEPDWTGQATKTATSAG